MSLPPPVPVPKVSSDLASLFSLLTSGDWSKPEEETDSAKSCLAYKLSKGALHLMKAGEKDKGISDEDLIIKNLTTFAELLTFLASKGSPSALPTSSSASQSMNKKWASVYAMTQVEESEVTMSHVLAYCGMTDQFFPTPSTKSPNSKVKVGTGMEVQMTVLSVRNCGKLGRALFGRHHKIPADAIMTPRLIEGFIHGACLCFLTKGLMKMYLRIIDKIMALDGEAATKPIFNVEKNCWCDWREVRDLKDGKNTGNVNINQVKYFCTCIKAMIEKIQASPAGIITQETMTQISTGSTRQSLTVDASDIKSLMTELSSK